MCRGPCLDVWAWVHGLTSDHRWSKQRRCHLAYDVRADYFQHLSYSNLRMMLKPLSWKQSDSKVASLKVFASIRFRQTQHVKVFWIHNQDVGLFSTAKQVAINHQVNQKGSWSKQKKCHLGFDMKADYFQHLSSSNLRLMLKPVWSSLTPKWHHSKYLRQSGLGKLSMWRCFGFTTKMSVCLPQQSKWPSK